MPQTRVRTRLAAEQTLEWAIAQGRAPRDVRDYPAIMALIRAGLLAHLANKNQSNRPFQMMDRLLRWEGMAGLSEGTLCPVRGSMERGAVLKDYRVLPGSPDPG